jgi:kumamolisin
MSVDRVELVGSERQVGTDVRRVGKADPGEKLSVSVQVRRRPDAQPMPSFAALGAEHPRRRQRLDREAVGDRYGADPDEITLVEKILQAHDLEIEASSPAGRTVTASGTVEQMNTVFGVELNMYEDTYGAFRSREGHIRPPRELADLIERVSGLTNRPLARPHVVIRPDKVGANGSTGRNTRSLDDQPVSSFSTVQIAQMYEFPHVSDGSGVCIGLIELGGGYSVADLDAYFGSIGTPTPTVVDVSVDGAVNSYPSGDDGEVELDIEVCGTVAPGATIAVYFAPNTEQGFIDAITQATFDTTNRPSVLSISWGAPEDAAWTQAGLNGLSSAFEAAAMAGVTVLAASGDAGSDDRVGDGAAHCDYPASDPLVIACGGTSLQVVPSGSWGEVVWNDPINAWATGGGVSSVFDMPSWQAGKDVPTSVNGNGRIGRGVPDLAANADPLTGYNVVIDGSWVTEGGTSAVAPLYAGLLAVIIAGVGYPLGFITPYLYSLAGKPDVLADVTQGTNQIYPAPGYTARTGWDACTGLGRVRGRGLLAYL